MPIARCAPRPNLDPPLGEGRISSQARLRFRPSWLHAWAANRNGGSSGLLYHSVHAQYHRGMNIKINQPPELWRGYSKQYHARRIRHGNHQDSWKEKISSTQKSESSNWTSCFLPCRVAEINPRPAISLPRARIGGRKPAHMPQSTAKKKW